MHLLSKGKLCGFPWKSWMTEPCSEPGWGQQPGCGAVLRQGCHLCGVTAELGSGGTAQAGIPGAQRAVGDTGTRGLGFLPGIPNEQGEENTEKICF